MLSNIRNFAIIAHIDHGKSTLADRLMEFTGTIEKNRHEEQMLDRNPISRERGITIKLAPVRMEYNPKRHPDSPTGEEGSRDSSSSTQNDIATYILNLIDTPGHVDFSYEVDRTLACVEGVVLLVDCTQGIQAQTISNAYKALEKDLVIIPVLNKIDLPNAEVERTKKELVDFLGVHENEIIQISAKTGMNVHTVLDRIVNDIPAPKQNVISKESQLRDLSHTFEMTNFRQLQDDSNQELKALIFDSYFDTHKGVVSFVRIFSGQAHKGKRMNLAIGHTSFEATEVGIFTPDLMIKESLQPGEIGYIVTNLKDIHTVNVGDTITDQSFDALPGYKKVKPVVYASMFPTDPADYENLKKALEKIYLNDSSLEFNAIYSQALGAGFRVGFLGLLHADVIRERLEVEYNLSLILTPPQVDYKYENEQYFEPIVRILIIAPKEYVGAIMQLCEDHRAIFNTMDNKNQVSIEYEMPMSEMVSDFFDKLKSITSGYASFDWELLRYELVEADKLAILLNGDEVEEFSQIVVAERAQKRGNELTAKLKELIPRQQFEVKIQAQYKGRIIAAERLSALRKDVLTKNSKTVGGGDYSRKRKLLEKQKEGKKKMKMIGKVEVPKEAFISLFKRE
ncbi:MAG TPA: GTP-binding protein [Candidatus Woesebacteria bacterium]|nr:GTP-binding protein [Candidatus Woesebacteria bacterium]